MKNYIILRNSTQEHYFINSSGIYSHALKNGFWTSPQLIDGTALKDFALFKDESECIHIVSCDRSNSITYTLIRGERISHHTILSGKPLVSVSEFNIKSKNGFMNLFYIAEVGGETLLIHCILGNNSQPSILGKIICKDYFVHDSRVYYTNKNSVLGYNDFSDGRPTDFVPLFENSFSPYINGFAQNRHMVWKCGDNIMLDGVPIISDKNAVHPIIVSNNGITVMWERSGIIHYAEINNAGEKSGTPMRFISTGKQPELFCVQNYDDFKYYYGTHSGNEVNIFGKSNIFEHQCEPVEHQHDSNDVQRLKIMIEIMQKEINGIKKQLKTIRQFTDKM